MFPLKITIDTKEDSPEDLRKIVALLSQLIGKDSVTNKLGARSPDVSLVDECPS